MADLKGRIALVTGAARGIGRETALTLLRRSGSAGRALRCKVLRRLAAETAMPGPHDQGGWSIQR
jgi:NAD(P)-dependent dehydrogenase (short-subunit alcohol dehydrogenase family)